MNEFTLCTVDAVVIGAGHAGCEAALALARTGRETVMLTLNLDSIAFMACNPSIGGTAKGHLVREIDALGGEMGVNADKTCLQIRMLNVGKGAAVQSLRAQCDKNRYHTEMKRTLEHTEHLRILQGEAASILVENGKIAGVKTTYGGILVCKAVIVATGVYLNSETITGEEVRPSGPNGFSRATYLTESLRDCGYRIRRFKTGTPARLDGRTVDFSACTPQKGDTDIYPFSYLTPTLPSGKRDCYLTYTNGETHRIILDNLDRSPLYNGLIKSTGPRYCPSIETKVVRFADKERHQLFLEPEGEDTLEVYVQGLSTSLPHDVQLSLYRTVKGLERAEFMRFAYAIEYDCIDTADVLPTLESKHVEGLYTAGQINGTSGYEEAAAQGLIAGLNASLKLRSLPPLVLRRDESYIGVMIDDLCTKGTDEPYRIMTSRAEYRLLLRQDNADFRLTEYGRAAGLVKDERYEIYCRRKDAYARAISLLSEKIPFDRANAFLLSHGEHSPTGKVTYADLVKRGYPIREILKEFSLGEIDEVWEIAETEIKYEGYLKKSLALIEKAKKWEEKPLPPDLDYPSLGGLRLEAREKLAAVRPLTVGQASRIPGVNPADVSVLLLYLSTKHKEEL